MLENILNLEGVSVLNKTQQKTVSGGGTCAYINGDRDDGQYDISKKSAQVLAAQSGGRWCCDSCETASWYTDAVWYGDGFL